MPQPEPKPDPKPDPDSLRTRLRSSLRDAMKARDKTAVDALRSALSAVDNAEAVPRPTKPTPTPPRPTAPTTHRIAGAVHGTGAGDVARRELTEDDIRDIVRAEIVELRSHADDYQRLGQEEQATRLRAQADQLEDLLRD